MINQTLGSYIYLHQIIINAQNTPIAGIEWNIAQIQ